MRSYVGALALAPLLMLTVACGGEGSDTPEESRQVTILPSEPDSSQAAPDQSPGSPGTPEQGTTACEEVVAGIADFNAGDFAGTVVHFEAAVPLAESEAEATPGQQADDLLEAVRYYAELAPEAYQEASLSSPEFAKYKEITLRQCASDSPPDDGGVFA